MREIAARMREAATKVGTTSTLWDVVFDAEAILIGEVSWADRRTVERFPVTLVSRSSGLKLLGMSADICAFIAENDAQLKRKD